MTKTSLNRDKERHFLSSLGLIPKRLVLCTSKILPHREGRDKTLPALRSIRLSLNRHNGELHLLTVEY
jgi:hypothetical protein